MNVFLFVKKNQLFRSSFKTIMLAVQLYNPVVAMLSILCWLSLCLPFSPQLLSKVKNTEFQLLQALTDNMHKVFLFN